MNIPPWSLLWRRAVQASALAAWAAPAAAQLPPDAVARALALVQSAAAGLAPPGARVEVQAGTLDPRLKLAPCAQADPYLPAGLPAWGATRVGLRCTAGTARWSVLVPVHVQVWAPAWVSTAALPMGAVLAEAQLGWAVVDWAAAAPAPHDRIEALAGRTLARAVAAGQPVRSTDLQVRQWFAAGETVRIFSSGSGYSVTAEGQALGPGLEGQPARVRIEGGRVLTGRAVGSRRVEVGL